MKPGHLLIDHKTPTWVSMIDRIWETEDQVVEGKEVKIEGVVVEEPTTVII
jgi:uncharacterized protein affecting Mg2+/Co2+ transport